MDKELKEKLEKAANEMRKDMVRMTYGMGATGAHIGGSLSMAEIMAVLYLGIMRYDSNNTHWEGRDRFILSKGHGAMAVYTALKQIGVLTDEELLTYKQNKTRLYAHPSLDMDMGVECSSGSLGMGISFAVGVAMALKRKGSDSKVYVLVGDGECDEGSVWEAAMSAAHYKLDNLIVIVDRNGLQYDGPTEEVFALGDIAAKWRAFGFNTIEVDGHSVQELFDAFNEPTDKPKAIIANTIKGKGVSFMENNPQWHNNSLSEENYNIAMTELERKDD